MEATKKTTSITVQDVPVTITSLDKGTQPFVVCDG